MAALFYNSPTITLFVGSAALIAAGIINTRQNDKAKAICSPDCACIQTAVSYLGWDGSRHIFEIVSTTYANSFMVANLKKLVNVSPEAWDWLHANGYISSPGKAQSARRDMT